MNILVVSQYYPPEPGACQIRIGTFVDGLIARGHKITVVCEQPNYPDGVFQEGFGSRPLVTERSKNLTIRRLWVAASARTTTAKRLAFYATFAAGAGIACATEKKHDVVFASSPPLPCALTACLASKLRRTPFVLDVRDLWPAAAVAFGELSSGRLLRTLERSERWLYRNSRAITTTTRPFRSHIDQIAGDARSIYLPNGAPDELLKLDATDRPARGTFTVGYAGNIGLGQGLEVVLDAADRLRDRDIKFVLLGDGAAAGELKRERDRRNLNSVEFKRSIPSSEVGDFLLGCDALLVSVRDKPALAASIAVKLYEAMAVGRPVIAAATGETAKLIKSSGCGLVVYPGDSEGLAQATITLADDRTRARELGLAGRAESHKYARSKQVERLEKVLIDATRN